MSEASVAPSPAASEAGGGFFQNLIDLYFSPREAFARIVRAPRILLPLAAYVAVVLGFTGVWMSKMDAHEFMKTQIEESPRADKMTAEQKQAVIETQAKMMPIFGWVFGPQSYIRTTGSDPKLALRHVVSNHQVAVDISVPVWWPKLHLEIQTEWVGNAWEISASDAAGSATSKPPAVKPAAKSAQPVILEVNRPISIGDLDSLATEVASGGLDPYAAADRLLGAL